MTLLSDFTLDPTSTFHRVFFTLQWSNLSSRTFILIRKKGLPEIASSLMSSPLLNQASCHMPTQWVTARDLLNSTRGGQSLEESLQPQHLNDRKWEDVGDHASIIFQKRLGPRPGP